MHRFLLILITGCVSLAAKAQDTTDYTQVGEVVHAFYSALSEPNDSARAARFEQLFTPEAQVNAIIQKTQSTASPALGSWKKFLENSQPFYTRFKVDYDEVERELEYYVDLASIHSLAYQVSTEKASGTDYRQMIWVQMDLVFAKDRWYIAYVSWVNEVTGMPIEDALLQDTLWHPPGN